MLRFITAGESHGPGLTAIIDGLPAGIPISMEYLNEQLNRRRKGFGRGARMLIESDHGAFTSGIRHGYTLGSPVTIFIENKDSGNWGQIMSPAKVGTAASEANDMEVNGEVANCKVVDANREVVKPRPGHGDLPGMLKYGHHDARNILERASARETAARVAAGAVCKKMLQELGIEVFSYVVSIGSAALPSELEVSADLQIENIAQNNQIAQDAKNSSIIEAIENSSLSCFDSETEASMITLIEKAKADGDSLGGVIKLLITGLPIGLGSHTQWDRRLDSALAAAIMSIQAVKGVEIGLGFKAAALPGSQVHDEITLSNGQIGHRTNNAGGIEGGISNGESISLKFAMKPIPTLYSPLNTINMKTGEIAKADVERSDVCAVPAAAVVGEAMAAFVIANFLTEKLGGDSMDELKRNLAAMKIAQESMLPKESILSGRNPNE